MSIHTQISYSYIDNLLEYHCELEKYRDRKSTFEKKSPETSELITLATKAKCLLLQLARVVARFRTSSTCWHNKFKYFLSREAQPNTSTSTNQSTFLVFPKNNLYPKNEDWDFNDNKLLLWKCFLCRKIRADYKAIMDSWELSMRETFRNQTHSLITPSPRDVACKIYIIIYYVQTRIWDQCSFSSAFEWEKFWEEQPLKLQQEGEGSCRHVDQWLVVHLRILFLIQAVEAL